jgi:hypothetical protein
LKSLVAVGLKNADGVACLEDSYYIHGQNTDITSDKMLSVKISIFSSSLS